MSLTGDEMHHRRFTNRPKPLGLVHNIHYIEDRKALRMARTMTLNVRVSGLLGDFVAANVGDAGAYENVSEYVRDLIRRDKERVEAERLALLKAELTAAFAAPEAGYHLLDADTVIARNRRI
jgi:Arc/MetJ-type ribon-helix-helix transcriptional regulator